ncbi:DUF1909-domain-containing protein [Hesseltinella vesiculosa]|uniref:DUF1909-domain-containing protein n=1 Tax=Hesseltinella vesiculosa TaxID=101127 RepID=A0A1X2GAX6_9FUNG|nr:DUF1909-domain-containing protein [Hesseltinella vesiculosa]
MGNGQKAQMKRERNAQKAAGKGGNSQLKVNAAAKNIICKKCFQTFLCTSREKALTEHAENKHGMSMKDCFPDYVPPP